MLPVVLGPIVGPIVTGVATGIMVQRYVLTPLGNKAVKAMVAADQDKRDGKAMAFAAAAGFFHGGKAEVEQALVSKWENSVFGNRKPNGRKATKVVDQDGNIAS